MFNAVYEMRYHAINPSTAMDLCEHIHTLTELRFKFKQGISHFGQESKFCMVRENQLASLLRRRTALR